MKSVRGSRLEHQGLYGLLLAFLPDQRLVDVGFTPEKAGKHPELQNRAWGEK